MTEKVYERKHVYQTEVFQLQDMCISEKEVLEHVNILGSLPPGPLADKPQLNVLCVLRAVPTTVYARGAQRMLPRSRPGSRRIAVWQRSAGRTGQTLPRTHGGDTQGPDRGRLAPPQQPRA
eukprot:2614319-Prymnesium_polylepis.1